MADSTTNLEQMAEGQPLNRRTYNQLTDAMSPASHWGRHAESCIGLTWGYYGGVISGTRYPNGTLDLDPSDTLYIEHDLSGVMSFNGTSFTAGKIPDYIVVTGTDSVSSYQDVREGGGSTLAQVLALLDIDSWVWTGDSLTITRNGKSAQIDLT